MGSWIWRYHIQPSQVLFFQHRCLSFCGVFFFQKMDAVIWLFSSLDLWTNPLNRRDALQLRPGPFQNRDSIGNPARRVSLLPPWRLPGGANDSFLPPWYLPGCPNGSFLPPWCLPGCRNGSFLPPFDGSFPASLVPHKHSCLPGAFQAVQMVLSCLPGASLSKAILCSERHFKGQSALRAANRGGHPRICRELGRSPLELY